MDKLDEIYDFSLVESQGPHHRFAEILKRAEAGGISLSHVDKNGIFITKSANAWMQEASKRPVPKMLFSEFWHEGELSILFADTNLGKSILAVQIADSISKGIPIDGFKMSAERQPVFYFDFEMNDKQFEGRYSENYTNHYAFDERFFRSEIDPETFADFDDSPEGFLSSIVEEVTSKEAKVLIIDNITYLGNDHEKARVAKPLMQALKGIKSEHGLSILALAHTPKRDLSRAIGQNDLQGSKMIINFADSAFAIGKSNLNESIRYLKMIKARATETIYHSNNVCVCGINKAVNVLRFDHLGQGVEIEHLKPGDSTERASKTAEAKRLRAHGLSQRDIARALGISVGSVNGYLKDSGSVVDGGVHGVHSSFDVEHLNMVEHNDYEMEVEYE